MPNYPTQGEALFAHQLPLEGPATPPDTGLPASPSFRSTVAPRTSSAYCQLTGQLYDPFGAAHEHSNL